VTHLLKAFGKDMLEESVAVGEGWGAKALFATKAEVLTPPGFHLGGIDALGDNKYFTVG
jgi:hypothetical protein